MLTGHVRAPDDLMDPFTDFHDAGTEPIVSGGR